MRKKLTYAAIFLGSMLLIGTNLYFLCAFLGKKYTEATEYYEPGAQFSMFKPHLSGVKKMGYITNKNLSREKSDGIWLQAQYYLAPTILMPTQLSPTDVTIKDFKYEYNIIDATTVQYGVAIFRRTDPILIANNEYGQALVQRRMNPLLPGQKGSQ